MKLCQKCGFPLAPDLTCPYCSAEATSGQVSQGGVPARSTPVIPASGAPVGMPSAQRSIRLKPVVAAQPSMPTSSFGASRFVFAFLAVGLIGLGVRGCLISQSKGDFRSAVRNGRTEDAIRLATDLGTFPEAREFLACQEVVRRFEARYMAVPRSAIMTFNASRLSEIERLKTEADNAPPLYTSKRQAYEKVLAELQSLDSDYFDQLKMRVRRDLAYVDVIGGKPSQRLGSFDAQAREAWKIAAERGVPEGQVLLGWSYALGVGVPQDDDKAYALYRSAAEQGLTAAEYRFGLMHELGRGVSQDYGAAVLWYRKAAAKGHAIAQADLCGLYYNGKGVSKDAVEAAKWCRKAADQGLPESQYNLGQMYWSGTGVTQDTSEAKKWLQKAAEQGLPRAQSALGNMYLDGDGVPRDPKQALVWFRKAADQGWADAQNNVGAMYAAGNGVPESQEEAIKWLRLAAKQGNAQAQKNLRQGNISW